MATNFLMSGDVIPYVAGAAYESGEVVPLGSQACAVALADIASGATGQVATEGVFSIPKTAGAEALAVGALLYYNTVTKVCSTTTSGIPLGICAKAALIGDASVEVLLGVHEAQSGQKFFDYEATFDATGGKLIGVHEFGTTLPANARIVFARSYVTTTFQDGVDDSATIALGVKTVHAAGLKAALAISNGANFWDAGVHDLLPVWTAATETTKTNSAALPLVATVAVRDLTAGVLTVKAIYVVQA